VCRETQVQFWVEEVQRDATLCRYLFTAKHVSGAMDARNMYSNLARLKRLAPQIVCSVPEAATTVSCTPDDGRDGRPKHVQ